MKKLLVIIVAAAVLLIVGVSYLGCDGEGGGKVAFTDLFETECDGGQCLSKHQGETVTVEVFYKGGNPSRSSGSYYSFFDNRSPDAPDLSPKRIRCDSDRAPELPVAMGERLTVTGEVSGYDYSELGSESGTEMVILEQCSYST